MHSLKLMFAALNEVNKAAREAERVAVEQYPVGTMLEWEKGRGVQCGVVLNVGYHHGPRFKVRNARTDKEYWVNFYDVVRAAGEYAREEYFRRAA